VASSRASPGCSDPLKFHFPWLSPLFLLTSAACGSTRHLGMSENLLGAPSYISPNLLTFSRLLHAGGGLLSSLLILSYLTLPCLCICSFQHQPCSCCCLLLLNNWNSPAGSSSSRSFSLPLLICGADKDRLPCRERLSTKKNAIRSPAEEDSGVVLPPRYISLSCLSPISQQGIPDNYKPDSCDSRLEDCVSRREAMFYTQQRTPRNPNDFPTGQLFLLGEHR
jgi:hypothetical protein